MTRWLLLRHGRTTRNAQRRVSGQDEAYLDYTGRWQAVAAGLALRGTPPPPLLLCSDLLRARQSAAAAAIAAGWPALGVAPWTIHPALRERRLGSWQGRSYDELRRTGEARTLVSWHLAPPGGESLADLAARLLGFLAQLPNQPGLIVAHAGPLRVLTGLASGLSPDEIGTLRIPHAIPMELKLPPGGWASLAEDISSR